MKFELQIDREQSSKVLGVVLRYARLREELSLRDLGELANVSHTLIANIENGKVVANADTLRELFRILKTEYRDDDALIDEFVPLYNHVFNNLYMYRYDRVADVIAELANQEEKYLNSILLVEYSLLRFLYCVLTDTMDDAMYANMDLMKRITPLLSDRQQQLRHLIVGIDRYNVGMFRDSYEELTKAIKIGDQKLDPLAYLYRIRSEVRMFMFMDAQKDAESTIKRFESEMNYSRAMQVRLELAYSNMLVWKFDAAEEYLNKVQQFGIDFDQVEFVDACNTTRATLLFSKGDAAKAKEQVQKIKTESPASLFVRMFLAYSEQDGDEIRRLYDFYVQNYRNKHHVREEVFFNFILAAYDRDNHSDEEYLDRLNRMIDVAKKGHNQEMLLFGYDFLINYYKEKRYYKQALEHSEKARQIRSYGFSVARED